MKINNVEFFEFLNSLSEEENVLFASFFEKFNQHCLISKNEKNKMRLDFEKAIKPFCKIAGCKIVSYDPSGEVVLEIVKLNKKGNIIYHLPVKIVDGKMLAKSFDISNATVVE
jgi:hypothetical protein